MNKIEKNILRNLYKIKPKINESFDPIIREKKYNTYLDEIYKDKPISHIKNIENEPLENSSYISAKRETLVSKSVKKNILQEIKNKINNNIIIAKNKLEDLGLDNYLFDKFQSFNFNTYDNKYTRKIVKNYVNNKDRIKILNQIYYNYILGGSINLSIELLKNSNIKEINILLNNVTKISPKIYELKDILICFYYNHLSKYIKTINSIDLLLLLKIKKEFIYLLYIFIYTLSRVRIIIEFIKNEKMSILSKYGKIELFDGNTLNFSRSHPFNMDRFINYNRLDNILNNINKEDLIDITHLYSEHIISNGLFSEFDFYPNECIKNSKKLNKLCPRYKEGKYFKIIRPEKINFKKYIIKLDIPEDFFNEYLLDIYNDLKRDTYMFIKFFTYNSLPKRLEYFIKKYKNYNNKLSINDNMYDDFTCSSFNNYLGNNYDNYKNNICILLIILSYCLNLLKFKDIRDTIFLTIENDMDKIKKIIIIFYYLFIYLMIFKYGTASIAEISLFTLWDTYVNFNGSENLILNQNTMLDVEVLSLPFSKFYTNCFNQDFDGDIYTPYFI